MKRLRILGVAVVLLALLTGGNCSRARVESMNHMNEGVVYARQKRYLDAVKSLERATGVDPQNDQAFYNLALVHIEMRKFEAAKDDLSRAIAVNADKAGYHEKMGTVLMQLEDWQGAKEAFTTALEKAPSLFKAHYKLGQVEERLAQQASKGDAMVQHQQAALEHYTTAIEKGPRFIEAYSSLGRLYADLGYFDEAAQVLESGLEVAPEGSDTAATLHHLLGTVFQQQRKFDQAIDHFDAALDISPGHPDALFSIGWTYSLTDNREEARRYLKKFIDVAGGDETPSHYKAAARDKLSQLGEGP